MAYSTRDSAPARRRSPTSKRAPLLDRQSQANLERRGQELGGLALLALAALAAVMLWSYSPDDPNWLVATDGEVRNRLGRPGAALAHPLMLVLGRAAWGIPALLAIWGARLMLHRAETRARTILAPAAIAALAPAFATLPRIEDGIGPGGLLGDTVLGLALTILPIGTVGVGALLWAGAGLLALFVAGVTRRETAGLRAVTTHALVVAYDALVRAGQAAARAIAATLAWAADRIATIRVVLTKWVAQRADSAAERKAAAAAAAVPAPRNGIVMPGAMPAAMAASRAVIHRAQTTGETPRDTGGLGPARMPSRAMPPPMAFGATPAQAATDFGTDADLWDADWTEAKLDTSLDAMTNAPAPGLAHDTGWTVPTATGQAVPAVTPSADAQPTFLANLLRRRPDADAPATAPDAALAPDAGVRSRIADAILARTRRGAPTRPLPIGAGRTEPPLLRPEPPLTGAAPSPAVAQAVATALARRPAAAAATLATPALAVTTAATGALAGAAAGAVAAAATTLIARRPEPAPDEDLLVDDEPVATAAAPVAARKPASPKPAPVAAAAPEPYAPPPLDLLSDPAKIQRHHQGDAELDANARALESVLDDFGVKGEIVSVRPGPVVTMYELEPAPGVKASRVIGLADDIARNMSALSARVSTVPGRNVIGIELPNARREKVVLREILSAADYGDPQMRLPLALGKDIGGEPIVANLAKMPHLLIAGTTGSGKSVAINTMILSLLYKLGPEDCRLIMIDPKMLELSVYDGIPHLLSPVVTDPKKAVVALKWVVGEMEERYRKMSKMGVRNIDGYNGRVREALAKGEMFSRTVQTGFDDDTGDPVFETDEFAPEVLPYIVVIVDEMADLMMVAGKEIEACIQRLAQMARASGIHLIMATQRPSVDVITGTIKANFPTRISFQVTSKIDSRTILGEQGAEQLLGQGDMLYMAGGGRITRVHGPFCSDEEVEEIVAHLKAWGEPSYVNAVLEETPELDEGPDVLTSGGETADALYDMAVQIVARDRKCSTSYIQRKLAIGYNKAARLVDQMEQQGVVSAANQVGKREILVPEVH